MIYEVVFAVFSEVVISLTGDDAGWERWLLPGLAITLGAVTVVVEFTVAPAVVGGALLSGGFYGLFSQVTNKNQSNEEFAKHVAVGAVVGAGGGVISETAAGIIGQADVAAFSWKSVGVASAAGGSTTVFAHVANDGVDLAITYFGSEELKQKIPSARSIDEIWSKESLKRLGWNVTVAALAGAAFQSVNDMTNEAIDQRSTIRKAVPALTGVTVRASGKAYTEYVLTEDPNIKLKRAGGIASKELVVGLAHAALALAADNHQELEGTQFDGKPDLADLTEPT